MAITNWMAGASVLLHHAGTGFGFITVGLLCVAGLLLSCLSFSGTWLVVLATLVAAFLTGPEFPGWLTVSFFIFISILVEAADSVAGVWGVTGRGGSAWAGLAAFIGGLVGLAGGSIIPIPILGNLIGMMLGSFFLVYVVERHRLQKHDPAVHIAMGAVLARIAIVLLKVCATLGMIVLLGLGLLVK